MTKTKLYKRLSMVVVMLLVAMMMVACGATATSTVAPAAATTAPAAATTAARPTTAAAAATTAPAAATTAPAATTAAAVTTTAPAATTAAAVATTAPVAAATTAAAAGTTPQPAASKEGTLVIWADSNRVKALTPLIKTFTEQNKIDVRLETLAFGDIRDKLKVAAPAGQGPDIIIGANDWLGELVSNGLVDTLDLGTKTEGFDPVAIKLFTYEGKVYGLPVATEAIALVYNKDLVPTVPKTWEELKTLAKKLQDDKKVDQAFMLQQGDPYHTYPVFSGFGGYVFGKKADGSYDSKDLGLDSAGAKAAATELDSMIKSGLLRKDITGDIVNSTFKEGKTAMIFTGPWNIKDFRAAKVNFGVANIPTMKETARPFVGGQGFMVSSFGKNKLLSKTFLTAFIATDDTMKAIYEADPRYPAWKGAQGAVDADIKGFGESAKVGDPLPAIPAMASVWDSWTKAINLIYQQQVAPDKAMTDAASAIRDKIK